MEAVSIILPVCHSWDYTKLFLVYLDKPARKAFCRGGQQREVKLHFLAELVQILPHESDYLKPQVTGLLTLAVVMADKGHQGLSQTYEANRKCTVLEYLADGIIGGKIFRAYPYALTHKEWEVFNLLF